ncbi:hypothetical protein QJQ45_027533 [Haematococcus lacustris]|nr:hypothetical protein QJQ45_027533 [Haematococcus lacustris]
MAASVQMWASVECHTLRRQRTWLLLCLTLQVTIKEPEKVETVSGLGLKTHYVTYTVVTHSDMPGFIAEGMEVRRRFSDFDALHKFLRAEFRGLIIPPLPEKSFLQGKMAQDEFIRLRRADLQAFLKGLTRHPVLREAEAVKLFLLQPGELMRNPAWTYLIHPPPGARAMRPGSSGPNLMESSGDMGPLGSPAGGGAVAANLRAGLGSWVSWVKASVAQLGPSKQELSSEEIMLRQAGHTIPPAAAAAAPLLLLPPPLLLLLLGLGWSMSQPPATHVHSKSKELLSDLHRLLELCSESARSLCTHMEGLSSDMRELGRNWAMLSRFEEAVQAKVCAGANRTPWNSSCFSAHGLRGWVCRRAGVSSFPRQVGQYTAQGVSAGNRAADLNKAAFGSVKQHSVWRQLSVKTAASLVSSRHALSVSCATHAVTLHDYYMLVPEAIAALEIREAALTHLQTLQADLEAKQQQLEQLQAGGRKVPGVIPVDKQIAGLTGAITGLQEQIKVAQADYDLIRKRNQAELARLSLEREADFRRTMCLFASTQASLVQVSADNWALLARQYAE